MMNIMNLEQNTLEWLEFRQRKIGASDASSIMGVGFHSPYKLWRIKMGFEEVAENWAMKRGKEMEAVARSAFIKETGIEIFPKVVQHHKYDWMIASLDGISFCGKIIVEIKCPGKKDHAKALDGIVPEKYFPQLQHQMAVTGLNEAIYYSFRDNVGVAVKVKRDDEYIDKLIIAEKEFYECILDFSPPNMGEEDYTFQNSIEWVGLADEYKKCDEELKVLLEKKEELKTSLVKISDGHNSDGFGVRLTKVKRRGRIIYSNISEIENIDLEKYRGPPSESWLLTVEKSCDFIS